jgi:hypothetical protein
MKTNVASSSIAAALALAGSSTAGVFTAGSLIVQRMGDGSTTLSSAATSVSVQEFARTGGSAVQTIVLPTTGNNQVTDSGSATSNGYLNVFNGYVGVSGYNSATGTSGVASLNTKVGTVLDGNGDVASRTLFPTGGTSAPISPFASNNFRSMIATGANTFYATGTGSGTPSTGGAWYYNGSSFTQVSSTSAGQPTNLRNVEIYGGQLYASSAASTGYGIWSIGSGLPTAGNQTSTLVINSSGIGTGTGSSYGFVMFDTNNDSTMDLAYVADDRTSAGGGIQKWVLSNGTWSASWALLVNSSGALQATASTGFAGLRGLTGTWDAVNGAQLFATTTETTNNRLISIIDNGIMPTSATTLASAGSNYVFRGVDVYTSIPAPGAIALLGAAGLVGTRRRR